LRRQSLIARDRHRLAVAAGSAPRACHPRRAHPAALRRRAL